jgi:hypothetical protein
MCWSIENNSPRLTVSILVSFVLSFCPSQEKLEKNGKARHACIERSCNFALDMFDFGILCGEKRQTDRHLQQQIVVAVDLTKKR